MSLDPLPQKVGVLYTLPTNATISEMALAIIMARTLALYDFSYFVVFAMIATGLGIVVSSDTLSEFVGDHLI